MKTVEERKSDFIRRAMEIHAGEGIDYSHVEYKDNRTPVRLIDPEYGEFWQTPSNHLKGQKHPKRRGDQISKSKQFTTEEFIQRAKEAHPDENLDYSKTVYRGAHEKVCIISHDLRPDGTEYGEFWQEANAHLKGCSHPELGIRRNAEAQRSNTSEFIRRAKMVHADKDYSYEKVEYVGSQVKVCVTCHAVGRDGKEHGDFYVNPDNMLTGKGCPKCGNHTSYAEDEIVEFLIGLLGPDSVVLHDRFVLGGKGELDIYVPSLHVAFEFNGIRWHSERFGKDKWYHLRKTETCHEKGIMLFHIFEDEWKCHKNVVLSKIRHIVGGNAGLAKIGARKCRIETVSPETAMDFLDRFHIQGYTKSTVHFGAYFKDVLIAVMSFTNMGDGKWTLTRYATDSGYLCQGVAGKLFKHFLKNAGNVVKVKSFLDRRWTRAENSNLYTKLGFTKDGIVGPDYRYTNGHGERLHKFGFRKQILLKKYPSLLSPDMTETQMTEKLGYWKIWDCGLIRYIYKNGAE